MKAKKIIALVMVLVLMIGTLSMSFASATTVRFPAVGTNPSAPNLTIGQATLTTAGNVTVPINIVRNPGIWAMNFQIAIPAGLTFVNANANNSVFNPGAILTSRQNRGVITIFIERNVFNNTTGNGVVLNLVFNVPSSGMIANRAFPINFTYVNRYSFTNAGRDDVSFTFTNGRIRVGAIATAPARPAQPSRPIVRVTNASGNRAAVSWQKVANATRYRVYRRRVGANSWTRVATTSALRANNIPISRSAGGRRYDFRVVAVNAAEIASTPSSHRRVATLSNRRPTISVRRGHRRFTVRRTNNIPNVSRYEIRFRRVRTRNWTTRRIARANSRVITGRRSGGRYEIRLRAVRTANGRTVNGTWSRTHTVTVR